MVFTAAHLGFPMDRTPLGGGAMVGLQLMRHWAAQAGGARIVGLGAGPEAPEGGLEYHRLPEGDGATDRLVSLSEMQYAGFCRRFEKATTDWLLSRRAELPPERTAVLVNDISEGPDLRRLTDAGYPVLSIWHVDVVDYFNKLYMRGVLSPESAAGLYESVREGFAARLVPDVLRLVFEKQRETVRLCRKLIFPSSGMADVVRRCYGEGAYAKRLVVPWGTWAQPVDETQADDEAQALRAEYGIADETITVLTVSRISPEKGLHLLVEAIEKLEKRKSLPPLCLIIGGEPAFMQGRSYFEKVKRAASRLKKTQVVFPGYLSAQKKRVYYRLADLFVSPSVHDSYGLNIVEAMSAGLPILASDHYGVRDILKPAFGLAVQYGRGHDADALGTGLFALAAGKARLKKMGAEARAAAAEMPFSKAAATVLDACLGELNLPAEASR